MAGEPITVVETPMFLRQAADIWTDDEKSEFVDFIARNPAAGDLIQGTGGVRKVRWSRQGTGKRGGVRVIHFFHDVTAPVYLLLIYAKSQRDDLSPEGKRAMRNVATAIKSELDRKRYGGVL